MHTHIAMFWLKQPTNKEHRDRFELGLSILLQDSNIRTSKFGSPAATSRDVVESSYDFAIVVDFDDLDGHNAYQVGKCHEVFLAMCSQMWKRVKVVDVET